MIERSETATTVIHLGKSDIDAFRIIYPSSGLLDLFGKIIHFFQNRTIRSKKNTNNYEFNLVKLRI